MAVVYLGLGTNLGDRLLNLRDGLRRLKPAVRIEAISDLYETAPWGVEDQPSFYNAAARGSTDLSPRELLRHLKQVERDAGRVVGRRWGPRVLDIDILYYDLLVLREPDLELPHPRIPERAFVLRPLSELAPELVDPVRRLSVAEMLRAAGEEGVEWVAGPEWADAA